MQTVRLKKNSPSRLLQVRQQHHPCSGPHWRAYGIRTTEWSRSPNRRGSRTEDTAPTTSPDFSGQARAAWCRSGYRPSAAAPSPGTRHGHEHGHGHGHGAGPGQARADGTSGWTHGAGQTDRSGRNHTSHHGEYRDGKLVEINSK